jgi:L-cystine uptake protein TcyP (sodium:dicarboxylate symporter family)
MDASNKVLHLVGHAISLDKVLMRIARLAPGSMLAGVCTHQQTSNTSTNEQHEQMSDELQC